MGEMIDGTAQGLLELRRTGITVENDLEFAPKRYRIDNRRLFDQLFLEEQRWREGVELGKEVYSVGGLSGH